MRRIVNRSGREPTNAHLMERKSYARIANTAIRARIRPFTMSQRTSWFQTRLKYAIPAGLNSIGVGLSFRYLLTAAMTDCIAFASHVLSCTQILALRKG